MKNLVIILSVLLLQQCSYSQNSKTQQIMTDSTKKANPVYSKTDKNDVKLSNEEWKKLLPEDVYYVARQKGTERPYTSPFESSKEIGTYYCAACGNPLFKSDTKF